MPLIHSGGSYASTPEARAAAVRAGLMTQAQADAANAADAAKQQQPQQPSASPQPAPQTPQAPQPPQAPPTQPQQGATAYSNLPKRVSTPTVYTRVPDNPATDVSQPQPFDPSKPSPGSNVPAGYEQDTQHPVDSSGQSQSQGLAPQNLSPTDQAAAHDAEVAQRKASGDQQRQADLSNAGAPLIDSGVRGDVTTNILAATPLAGAAANAARTGGDSPTTVTPWSDPNAVSRIDPSLSQAWQDYGNAQVSVAQLESKFNTDKAFRDKALKDGAISQQDYDTANAADQAQLTAARAAAAQSGVAVDAGKSKYDTSSVPALVTPAAPAYNHVPSLDTSAWNTSRQYAQTGGIAEQVLSKPGEQYADYQAQLYGGPTKGEAVGAVSADPTKFQATAAQAQATDANAVNLNRTEDQQTRNAQTGLISNLQSASAGNGPSIANDTGMSVTNRGLLQSLAAVASAHGNAALGAERAADIAGKAAMEGGRQAALQKFNEQVQARGELANAANATRSQDLTANTTQAQLQQQKALQDAAQRTDVSKTNAGAATNVSLANASGARDIQGQNLAQAGAAAERQQKVNDAYTELQNKIDIANVDLTNDQTKQQIENYFRDRGMDDQEIQQGFSDIFALQKQINGDRQNATLAEINRGLAVEGKDQIQQQINNAQEQQYLDNALKIGGAVTSAVGTLAGSAIASSDRRAKKNIRGATESLLRDFLGNLKPYEWDYKDPDKHGSGKRLGVMAQDLEKSRIGRRAVSPDDEGTKRVDYGKLMSAMLASDALHDKRITALEKLLGKKGAR